MVSRCGSSRRWASFRGASRLTDGSTREVDLGPYLNGPIFEPVRNDPASFGPSAWTRAGHHRVAQRADIDPDRFLGECPRPSSRRAADLARSVATTLDVLVRAEAIAGGQCACSMHGHPAQAPGGSPGH